METFSSEIGKKMRSAVKAKLIELGTEGGTAGYVDDELPDYVMIMVANKRSKQQMSSDLTLFLGNKTELFVTWLHEVLQKLQEVTVPAPAAKKRKSGSQKDEVSSKKDKKATKKEKKATNKKNEAAAAEKVTVPAENTAHALPHPTGSITDVFADELLEKAKHNLEANADAATQIKKGKAKKNLTGNETDTGAPSNVTKDGNEFDIPTISEISSTTGTNLVSGNRAKDLAELAEIQKKIYAAKKHLKELGELKDVESEDEDFLKLRDEGSSDELSDIGENTTKQDQIKSVTKAKSPIVFDKNRQSSPEKTRTSPPESRGRSPQPLSSAAIRTQRNSSNERKSSTRQPSRSNDNNRRREPSLHRSRDRDKRDSSPYNKRPVHERLGTKPQSNEQRQARREKELYVPAHRRQEARNERNNRDERWRSRDRDDRRNDRDQRERSADRERSRNAHSTERKEANKVDEKVSSPPTTTRHRVGSRVIVAPAKPVESSDDEAHDKPVNSVIKIKPRPPVSPSRQACKNLLLRAVAEAQRSTILTKPKVNEPPAISKVKARLGKTINTENSEELFTKTLRERRLKRGASAAGMSTLFRRQTQNFIIEVDGEIKSKRLRGNSQSSIEGGEGIETYKPEILSGELGTTLSVSYKAQSEEDFIYDEDEIEGYETEDAEVDEIALEKTQFVVTLNDDKAAQKLTKRKANDYGNSLSPQPLVSSSTSSTTRRNSNEPTSTTQFNRSRPREIRRSDIRSRLSKRPATPLSPSRVSRLKGRDSSNSSPTNNKTPPQQRRNDSVVDNLRKPKDVKKIIIKNDTDDDELSSPVKRTPEKEKSRLKRPLRNRSREKTIERRSVTPPLPKATSKGIAANDGDENSINKETSVTPKSKHIQIKFDLDTDARERTRQRSKNELGSTSDNEDNPHIRRDRRSKSRECSIEQQNGEERKRISIRSDVNNKYDNIPALSSVALDSVAMRVIKPKERCKYHPNCTKQFCDFYHPTAPCKAFPNCKYADKCLYSHPKCKYDMACTNIDCNFSHTGTRNPSQLQPTAPPLSSHVVPVQNYKTISASTVATSAMCKYYPNCSKVGCAFYHPKPCRFGKNCINKLECNFYHHELQSSSKFKWVASAT